MTIVGPAPIEAPSQHDAFVRGASETMGGPLGRHATRPRNRFWVVMRIVVALTALTLMLHWAQKSDCADGNWLNLKEYRHACYTDVVAVYASDHLVDGTVPYAHQAIQFPVITGLIMSAVGLPVHSYTSQHAGDDPYTWFYNINAFLLGLAAIATVIALLLLRRRRPWDAAMFAVAPVLALSATINWDLVGVALAVWALFAWSRRRPALAGTLLSLGASTTFWPALLIIPLLLLAWRARRASDALYATAVAVLVWVLVNLPFMIFFTSNWASYYASMLSRGIDWGSLWYIGANLPHVVTSGTGIPGFAWLNAHVGWLNGFSFGLFALAVAGIAWLTLRAPRRPRLAQLAFLVVAAFLIFSKVWSEQYALWLVPLALLARPRWGAFMAWQAAELCYYFALDGELMRPSGNPIFPETVFIIGALLRLATLLVLCGFVIRDMMRPERDVVRATYDGDPDGGPFDDAGADEPQGVELVRVSAGPIAR